ncbi:S1 RNA-binding domain-containing protein [Ammoniphilus sp. CFH 90114]|uniref:S1 RNA-binding domain-containing protein n=1 Tax=Ammoniphilus sp. CFH 90114 TaxID=2493665 RepID=UPI00100EC471|nr:S1 RNA-binding domain-containing protein [Ammoniphilus sp. CFH 90114]RXT14954.1 S1 RNA-binding domain-containing protein [Ammoniphilus sp. CFH 90114]
MSSELLVGNVMEGQVTAIKEYGAFVSLSGGRSGLVHISQIASEYVKQVEDYLVVGDKVTVKIIDISDAGKISLSIKQVAPLGRRDGTIPEPRNERKPLSKPATPALGRPERKPRNHDAGKEKMNSLEEKLKKWMKSSEERMQDLGSKQKRK